MKFKTAGLFFASALLVASCANLPTGNSLGNPSSADKPTPLAGVTSAKQRYNILGGEYVCEPCRFKTYTQGGWGQVKAEGHNVATVRNALFDGGFTTSIGSTSGLVVNFNDSQDVIDFMAAAQGTPGALPNAGIFGAQVLALTLNLAVNQGLGNAVIVGFDPDGNTIDNTVADLLDVANFALGTGTLPTGFTFSELNDLVTFVNEYFRGGVTASPNDFLCPVAEL